MKSDDNDDRLRSIHAELSRAEAVANDAAKSSSSSSPWLPLESNPEIFTSFARQVGSLPDGWSFVDVLGFDDELMKLTPRPVAAVILLFPCTERIYSYRAKEKRQLLSQMKNGQLSSATKKAFHLEQVASFGNACGTIAAIHSLTNAGLASSSSSSPFISGPIAAFRDSTKNLSTPEERGKVLVSSNVLHNLSDEAATNTYAQTICPDRGDTKLGHHYCSFVPILNCDDNDGNSNDNGEADIHVVELDGTKVCPVDHGPMKNNDFLQSVAEVVKKRWMSLEPNRIDFSLMALAKTG